MTLLTTRYLWKEWRDQRATLGWLALALFLLAGGGGLFAPQTLVHPSPTLVAIAMGLTFLSVLLTVGADLLPGEIVRRRLRFLERLPAGLGVSFRAKLILLAGVSLASAIYGAMLVLLFSTIRRGRWPDGMLADGGTWVATILAAAAFFFVIALWIFAISSWVPRGALALPAAAILLSLLGWPAWWMYLEDGTYVARSWEVKGLAGLFLLGAPLVAWVSYTRGLRFGRGSSQAAGRGLGVAALVFLPSWGWTGQRIHQLDTIDPSADDFRISGADIGNGERIAFVTAMRGFEKGAWRSPYGPFHALIIDLETGEWRSEGKGSWARHERHDRSSSAWNVPGKDHLWLWGEEEDRCYDTATGLPGPAPEGAGADGYLPSAATLGLDDAWCVIGKAGTGYRTLRVESTRARTRGYFDPHREGHFLAHELDLDSAETVYVRPGRWLVLEKRSEGWKLFDPETLERESARGLGGPVSTSGDDPLADDGRLIVLRGESVGLLDPESGAFEELTITPSPPYEVQTVSLAYDQRCRETIVSLKTWNARGSGQSWSGFALLDLETKTLHLARRDDEDGLYRQSYHRVWSNDRSAIVVEGGKLIRLHFDGRDPEILFPRLDS